MEKYFFSHLSKALLRKPIYSKEKEQFTHMYLLSLLFFSKRPAAAKLGQQFKMFLFLAY